MQFKLSEKLKLVSRVHLRHYDRAGVLRGEERFHNAYTYAGWDIFMSALLGSGANKVTHLYARFGDSGANPAYLSPPSGDLKKTNRSTFLQSSDGIRGGLWVPVLSAPRQEPTDATLYVGNRATFFFRIPFDISNTQVDPDNFSVSTSFIYALGLGVARNASDRNQDVIASYIQAVGWDSGNPGDGEFTKFQVINGGQSTVDYVIELTAA